MLLPAVDATIRPLGIAQRAGKAVRAHRSDTPCPRSNRLVALGHLLGQDDDIAGFDAAVTDYVRVARPLERDLQRPFADRFAREELRGRKRRCPPQTNPCAPVSRRIRAAQTRPRQARQPARLAQSVPIGGTAASGRYLRSVSPPPKRLLKRATWPPASSIVPRPPVQAGCDSGSISRRHHIAFLAPGRARLIARSVGHLDLDHVIFGMGIGFHHQTPRAAGFRPA